MAPVTSRRAGRRIVAEWDDGDDGNKGQSSHRGPEPEGAGEAYAVGEQTADRVARTGSGRGRHGQQPDHRGDALVGHLVPGGGHGERGHAQANALQGPAEDEHVQSRGQGGDDAACGHGAETADHGGPTSRAVAQAAHDRGAHGA